MLARAANRVLGIQSASENASLIDKDTTTMFNPILSERVAHEQYKDRLREAEQRGRIKAAIACQPTDRLDPRTSLGDLLIAVRHLFKALARRRGTMGS
jgi:hypothetical protein